jgi:hypothetical protein
MLLRLCYVNSIFLHRYTYLYTFLSDIQIIVFAHFLISLCSTSCLHTSLFCSKNMLKLLLARGPKTPLGELTALPRPPSCIEGAILSKVMAKLHYMNTLANLLCNINNEQNLLGSGKTSAQQVVQPVGRWSCQSPTSLAIRKKEGRQGKRRGEGKGKGRDWEREGSLPGPFSSFFTNLALCTSEAK